SAKGVTCLALEITPLLREVITDEIRAGAAIDLGSHARVITLRRRAQGRGHRTAWIRIAEELAEQELPGRDRAARALARDPAAPQALVRRRRTTERFRERDPA